MLTPNVIFIKGNINLIFDNLFQINITKVNEWFFPAMANYCRMFEIDCRLSNVDNDAGECGLNDDCKKDEFCFNNNSSRGFECGYKSKKGV